VVLWSTVQQQCILANEVFIFSKTSLCALRNATYRLGLRPSSVYCSRLSFRNRGETSYTGTQIDYTYLNVLGGLQSLSEIKFKHKIRTFNTGTSVYLRSRSSVVGIAIGYELEDRGVEARVPVGSRTFPSYRLPDRLCGSPASYPMGTGGCFPGSKAVGA
jgi:hypothetical protein